MNETTPNAFDAIRDADAIPSKVADLREYIHAAECYEYLRSLGVYGVARRGAPPMIDATVAAEMQREYARLLRTPVADCLAAFGWRQGSTSRFWILDAPHRRFVLDTVSRALVVQHEQPGGWGRPIRLRYPQNAAELFRAPA